MKTDVVLTMDEFLHECRCAATNAKVPARNARRIPVEAPKDVEIEREGRGCRCDRWGHSCTECVERNAPRAGERGKLSTSQKLR